MAEIEAKFLLRRPEQLDEVLALLDDRGYAVEPAGTSTHVDRYFDTGDWAILRAGWAYRCRSRGKHDKLTLKSLDTGNDNVFVREEIEQALPKSKPSRKGKLPKGPVQALLKDIAGSAQREQLFRVESRRSIYYVATPDDAPARVELDFDQTVIDAEKRSKKAPGRMEFTELELELPPGSGGRCQSGGQAAGRHFLTGGQPVCQQPEIDREFFMTQTMTDIQQYLDDHAQRFQADLCQWLSMASIGTDPQYDDDVRAAGSWLKSRFDQCHSS